MAGSASTWQGQIHGDRDVQDSASGLVFRKSLGWAMDLVNLVNLVNCKYLQMDFRILELEN